MEPIESGRAKHWLRSTTKVPKRHVSWPSATRGSEVTTMVTDSRPEAPEKLMRRALDAARLQQMEVDQAYWREKVDAELERCVKIMKATYRIAQEHGFASPEAHEIETAMRKRR